MSEDGERFTVSDWPSDSQSMNNGRFFCHSFVASTPETLAKTSTRVLQYSDGASAREWLMEGSFPDTNTNSTGK